MSLVVRGTRVYGQYVSARTRLEPTERATKVEAVTVPIALPAGRGSLVLAGAVGFTSDWGGSYRVTSVTNVDTYAEGGLAGPVRIAPTFDALVREEGERVRVCSSVELSALLAVTRRR